jgi:hypothetical protein
MPSHLARGGEPVADRLDGPPLSRQRNAQRDEPSNQQGDDPDRDDGAGAHARKLTSRLLERKDHRSSMSVS